MAKHHSGINLENSFQLKRIVSNVQFILQKYFCSEMMLSCSQHCNRNESLNLFFNRNCMRVCIFFCLCFIAVQLSAQKIDKKLQHQIEEAIKGFNGDFGIYVKNLKNNKIVAINADTIFPTASMIKIPILIGITDKINKGELEYHQVLKYRD